MRIWRVGLLSLVALGLMGLGTQEGLTRPPKLNGSRKAVKIDGAVGGVVKLGRFTATVPAGAFRGNATIILTVPEPSAKICQLEITPNSNNTFAAPVILSAKVNDAGVDKKHRLAILYFDPVTETWTEVPGSSLDPDSGEVSAPLYHFSIYGVGDPLSGRSGW